MTLITILFLSGVLFLAFEILVPGAVLGIIGGLSLAGGVVVAFSQFGAGGGLLALGVAVALVAVTLYLEFAVLPKTSLARKFSMTDTVASVSQPPLADLQAVIDREGEAATALAPSGYVNIGGRRYEAFSQSGFLDKGVAVRVTGLDNFRLIVTKSNHTS